MLDKSEIDLILGVLNSFLMMLESIDPALKNSVVIADIVKATNTLEALGL